MNKTTRKIASSAAQGRQPGRTNRRKETIRRRRQPDPFSARECPTPGHPVVLSLCRPARLTQSIPSVVSDRFILIDGVLVILRQAVTDRAVVLLACLVCLPFRFRS
jgi:hypothetical protein